MNTEPLLDTDRDWRDIQDRMHARTLSLSLTLHGHYSVEQAKREALYRINLKRQHGRTPSDPPLEWPL